jgi:hypothetical protein
VQPLAFIHQLIIPKIITHEKVATYVLRNLQKMSCVVMQKVHHNHHQLIIVLTGGAQAFLMDYLQGQRAITHDSPVRFGGC